jgi:hypothetical protein
MSWDEALSNGQNYTGVDRGLSVGFSKLQVWAEVHHEISPNGLVTFVVKIKD